MQTRTQDELSQEVPLISKIDEKENINDLCCACNLQPCCCVIGINKNAFSTCVTLKDYSQFIFRVDVNDPESTRNRFANGVCITIVILPTIGPTIYTMKEIVYSFKESISWGAVRSIVAAAGGVAGWFASESLATVISHATSHQVSPLIIKPMIQSWSATLGSATTTFLSDVVRCRSRVHDNRSTLFAKPFKDEKHVSELNLENKQRMTMV